jgi:hypothetical protein
MKRVILLTVLLILAMTGTALAEEDITYTGLNIESEQQIPLQLDDSTAYTVSSVTGGDNITATIYSNNQPVVIIQDGVVSHAVVFAPRNCYIALTSAISTEFNLVIELLPCADGLLISPSNINIDIGDSIELTATLDGQPVVAEYIVPDFMSNSSNIITALSAGEGNMQASYCAWQEDTLISYVVIIPVVVH